MNDVEHARAVIDGAAPTGGVSVTLEELDGKYVDGKILGIESHHTFSVFGSGGEIAELQAGFHDGAVNLGALRALRVFLEEVQQVAHHGGAVIASLVDGFLEVLLF